LYELELNVVNREKKFACTGYVCKHIVATTLLQVTFT
jgi:hypothetical protein